MAPATTTGRPARPRLTLGKAKGKAKARGGPQAVGGAPGGKKRPNRFLLGVLGVVAVAAIGHLAMPGLFGGGSGAVATFPAPLTNRHFGPHVTTTVPATSGTGATVGRPSRDPFTPPPGYGS